MLSGRVAVVTGASGGIGRAVALKLHELGCRHLVLGDRTFVARDGGPPVAEELRASGASVVEVACDVTRHEDVASLIAAAEQVGGVDVMVNNAGLFVAHDLFDASEEDVDALWDVNAKGVLFGCQESARSMMAHGRGGTIINVASMAADRGSAGQVGYHATKGAVKTMSWAIAAELGPHGIRVNSVHPGAVDTRMLRDDVSPDLERLASTAALGRLVSPGDVAGAVAFLASDLASGITGASLSVDCGLMLAG